MTRTRKVFGRLRVADEDEKTVTLALTKKGLVVRRKYSRHPVVISMTELLRISRSSQMEMFALNASPLGGPALETDLSRQQAPTTPADPAMRPLFPSVYATQLRAEVADPAPVTRLVCPDSQSHCAEGTPLCKT